MSRYVNLQAHLRLPGLGAGQGWGQNIFVGEAGRTCIVYPEGERPLNSNIAWGSGGTSLAVQWLGLHAPFARGPASIPGQGTRSHMLQLRVHMPQLKIPHATTKIPRAVTKTRCSQVNDKINKYSKQKQKNMASGEEQ